MGRRVTIYDILDKLVRGEAFHGYERDSALEVVADLRKLNGLGTLTGQTSVGEHQCQPFDTTQTATACTICDRRMIRVNGSYV
jgi:hypothetical protein